MRWTRLKRIANSSYAKLTIFVPVIGWLLVADNEIGAGLSKFGSENLGLTHPSWKLYALHVGLSLFGLGTGLFYLFCPGIIKENDDFADFAAKQSTTITSDQLDATREELPASQRPRIGQSQSLVFPQVGSDEGRGMWYRRNEDAILRTLFAYYNHKDSQFRLAQFVVWAFSVVGGLITFLPSAATIIFSMKQFYLSLSSQILNWTSAIH